MRSRLVPPILTHQGEPEPRLNEDDGRALAERKLCRLRLSVRRDEEHGRALVARGNAASNPTIPRLSVWRVTEHTLAFPRDFKPVVGKRVEAPSARWIVGLRAWV